MEKYTVTHKIASGKFSKVVAAINSETEQHVAIKTVNIHDIQKNEEMALMTIREVEILRKLQKLEHKKKLSSPYIINLVEILETDSDINIIMEHIEGPHKDLFDLIEKAPSGRLSEQQASKYFWQLLEGVLFLHSVGIAHRDLKPENILLDPQNDRIKITDFGCAGLFQDQPITGVIKQRTVCGTEHYAAPEVLNGASYDGRRADAWSCGIIIYTMLTGCHPFDDDSLPVLIRQISHAQYQMPPWISKEAKDLISKVLVPNPEERITIEAMQRHPWIRKFHNTDDTDGH